MFWFLSIDKTQKNKNKILYKNQEIKIKKNQFHFTTASYSGVVCV